MAWSLNFNSVVIFCNSFKCFSIKFSLLKIFLHRHFAWVKLLSHFKFQCYFFSGTILKFQKWNLEEFVKYTPLSCSQISFIGPMSDMNFYMIFFFRNKSFDSPYWVRGQKRAPQALGALLSSQCWPFKKEDG